MNSTLDILSKLRVNSYGATNERDRSNEAVDDSSCGPVRIWDPEPTLHGSAGSLLIESTGIVLSFASVHRILDIRTFRCKMV